MPCHGTKYRTESGSPTTIRGHARGLVHCGYTLDKQWPVWAILDGCHWFYRVSARFRKAAIWPLVTGSFGQN
jgi:hypothetical protein